MVKQEQAQYGITIFRYCNLSMNILNEKQIVDLTQSGWFAQDNFLSADLCQELITDFKNLQSQGLLQQAAVGRGGHRILAQDVRTDHTFWLTGETPAQAQCLNLMDQVRQQLNRELFLGLSDYEAHYACYQAGGFYKKHFDSFKGGRNRIVSTVLYLTPGWREEEGGHLIIYDSAEHDRERARISPVVGTLACFMSEDIPHEVLPPKRERISIAGWFRVTGGDILKP